ncbi:MAG: type 4b pilus protein PilO2 [Alphaproteobacteria bacterium]|nr:type 4b pilus protein PilO2 [Alphaproteobacteria bacterium]
MLEEAKLLDNDIEDGNSAKSWGSHITVDGVTYATSLFWQPLQNSSDPFQEVEDASAGVLEGADLFCIKSGKAPQFGICVSHEGYKSGENVGAAAVATSLSDIGSYVAVFKVHEGWWYICVRNDIILSDGDMLFFNEDEAKEQFMSMLAVPDWGKKIAPKEWDIEETEDVDLSEL